MYYCFANKPPPFFSYTWHCNCLADDNYLDRSTTTILTG
jgi:hypothetical protein